MHALFVLSVWIHILAAATWIGGSLFLVIVLAPTIRKLEFREQGWIFIHRVAQRFSWVGWSCFGLLIATGIFNLFVHGGMNRGLLGSGEFWLGSYGKVFAWKLALVGIILVLSAVHDFGLGPQTVRARMENPGSLETRRLLLMVRWAGRVNLLLGLAVMGLGVALVRGWPW